MSIEAVAATLKAQFGNPTRKLVALTLANYADEDGTCFPSIRTMASVAEVSTRSVRLHLKALEVDGWIEVEERWRENGGQSSNVYRLRYLTPLKNLHPPLEADVMGGMKPASGGIEEPSTEPSPEGVLTLEFEEPHLGPLTTARIHKDFEDLWQVHRKGAKAKAIEQYRAALQIAPHDHLLACLKLYVEHHLDENFQGAHLWRWLRDHRWQEVEHLIEEAPQQGAVRWAR